MWSAAMIAWADQGSAENASGGSDQMTEPWCFGLLGRLGREREPPGVEVEPGLLRDHERHRGLVDRRGEASDPARGPAVGVAVARTASEPLEPVHHSGERERDADAREVEVAFDRDALVDVDTVVVDAHGLAVAVPAVASGPARVTVRIHSLAAPAAFVVDDLGLVQAELTPPTRQRVAGPPGAGRIVVVGRRPPQRQLGPPDARDRRP